MEKQTVTYDKNAIIQILRALEVLVVSSDRIGSVWHDRESDEQYSAMFVEFFDDLGFFRKLSSAREILSEPFSSEAGDDGMDELERLMQDLKYWS